MRFSRHSRNRARLTKVTTHEVAKCLATSEPIGSDPDGNPLHHITIREIRIEVVIALDRPGFVITLYERD